MMKQSRQLMQLFLVSITFSVFFLFSCGEVDNPTTSTTNPVLSRFSQFFNSVTNNRTIEIPGYFSENCFPDKQLILDNSFGAHFNPAYCSYEITSQSFDNEIATLEVFFTISGTYEDTGKIIHLTMSEPVNLLTYSNEAGTWQIVRFPYAIYSGGVYSSSHEGEYVFNCVTDFPTNEYDIKGNTNPTLSPEVLSGPTFSQAWSFNPTENAWQNHLDNPTSGNYELTVRVYSTSEAPFNVYTITHHYSIP